MGRSDRFGGRAVRSGRLSSAGVDFVGATREMRGDRIARLWVVYKGASTVLHAWIEESDDEVTWTEISGKRVHKPVSGIGQHLWQLDRGRHKRYLRAMATSPSGMPFCTFSWLGEGGEAELDGSYSTAGEIKALGVNDTNVLGRTRRIDRVDAVVGGVDRSVLGSTPSGTTSTELCKILLPNGDAICLPNGDNIVLEVTTTTGGGGGVVPGGSGLNGASGTQTGSGSAVPGGAQAGVGGSLVEGDPTSLPLFDETNTGLTVAAGSLVDYFAANPQQGSHKITTDGIVLENFLFTSDILIQAHGVTIRNCHFKVNGKTYCINHRQKGPNGEEDFYTGLVVESCEFEECVSSALLMHEGLVQLCNIHDSGADGIKAEAITTAVNLRQNYMHRLGYEVWAANPNDIHADGVQTRSDKGGALIMFENNIQIAGHGAQFHPNACLIYQAKGGSITGSLRLERNRLNGGNQTVYITEPKAQYTLTEDWSLIDNGFGMDWNFGPISYAQPTGIITGNMRLDTGANVDVFLENQQEWT